MNKKNIMDNYIIEKVEKDQKIPLKAEKILKNLKEEIVMKENNVTNILGNTSSKVDDNSSRNDIEYGKIDDNSQNTTEKDKTKYPTTLGAIFKYTNEQINSGVSNKSKSIKYLDEPVNSNAYKISDDRKSITISDKTLKFDTEIYHACVYTLGDGGTDIWAILLKNGNVKYTTDYGKTIKNGPNQIIDLFAMRYEKNEEGYTFGGGTILAVNQYGTLYDLAVYNQEN